MEIQEENSAVRVIGFAGRSLCLENRVSGMQIFLPADRQGVREISSDEIALGIDFGVDPVVDQMYSLGDFNRNVVGGSTRPDGRPINLVIGFPDSKMMTPRDDRIWIGQGIRVVLHPSKQVKPGHRQ